MSLKVILLVDQKEVISQTISSIAKKGKQKGTVAQTDTI